MILSEVSLILCAHNPRRDFLQRVIGACVGQDTPSAQVEMVLVDSASSPPLEEALLEGCNGRIVRSELPGLARARVLGIQESKGDYLVFVDDDTVLAPNYVSEALRILAERPYLGAIGGQLIPEYEGPLPLAESYYRNYLAIREFQVAQWSNRWDDFATSPIGGGMVVRRDVAQAWVTRCEESTWRLALGRNGKQLSGGEDIDLLHMACEMGYGKGILPELILTHVMPARRLTPEFLVQIYEGNCRSGAFLQAMMNDEFGMPPIRLRHHVKVLIESLGMSSLDRRLRIACERGRRAGWKQAISEKGISATAGNSLRA